MTLPPSSRWRRSSCPASTPKWTGGWPTCSPRRRTLRGTAAVAMAVTAYDRFKETLESQRWLSLQRQGAQVQRLLWASTGVKDTPYPQTKYVSGLVAPHTVSTMPRATPAAVEQSTARVANTVTPNVAASRRVLADLGAADVDLEDVAATLESEGVAKFVTAWESLLAQLSRQLSR
jgi:transaldolase